MMDDLGILGHNVQTVQLDLKATQKIQVLEVEKEMREQLVHVAMLVKEKLLVKGFKEVLVLLGQLELLVTRVLLKLPVKLVEQVKLVLWV